MLAVSGAYHRHMSEVIVNHQCHDVQHTRGGCDGLQFACRRHDFMYMYGAGGFALDDDLCQIVCKS